MLMEGRLRDYDRAVALPAEPNGVWRVMRGSISEIAFPIRVGKRVTSFRFGRRRVGLVFEIELGGIWGNTGVDSDISGPVTRFWQIRGFGERFVRLSVMLWGRIGVGGNRSGLEQLLMFVS